MVGLLTGLGKGGAAGGCVGRVVRTGRVVIVCGGQLAKVRCERLPGEYACTGHWLLSSSGGVSLSTDELVLSIE